MTVLELSTAIGIFLAGLGGLMKVSHCKNITCGWGGCTCQRDACEEEPATDSVLIDSAAVLAKSALAASAPTKPAAR